jgi:nucleotide-binding universal stress UspA family protein
MFLKGSGMYKTIVVHIDGSAQQESRLRAAALLADAHGAHLIGTATTGVSWADFALLAGSMGGPIVPGSDFHALRDAAGVRLDAFAVQARGLGASSVESRLVEDDPRFALLLQSRYADLVVLSLDATPDPDAPVNVRNLPGHVALHGVRPVLVVPANYHAQPIPGTVVVGWDGSMQAIRAIDAALPLLQRADSVKLALVNPDELSELHGEEPGADMALYLARQGVVVDVVVERTRAATGDALIFLARTCGAGLLVAGAYGHSRFRELVLGGVTRELLDRSPFPVLFAH